jgi:WD40 repeat protein
MSPYLVKQVYSFSPQNIFYNLKSPIGRALFEKSVQHASIEPKHFLSGIKTTEDEELFLSNLKRLILKLAKAQRLAEYENSFINLQPDVLFKSTLLDNKPSLIKEKSFSGIFHPSIKYQDEYRNYEAFGTLHTLIENEAIKAKLNEQVNTLYQFRETSAPLYYSWSPAAYGALVASYDEHDGFVQHVIVSPDSRFFVTGDSLGAVRLWDSKKLVKLVTNKSRLSFKTHKSRITSMAWCSQTYYIAVGFKTGVIEVLHIDFRVLNHVIRYESITSFKHLDLDPGVYAVALYHYKTTIENNIIIATNTNKIMLWEMISHLIFWSIDVPLKYGMVSCMLVDPDKASWVVVGTNLGWVVCFDLRFKIQICEFRHSEARIHGIKVFKSDDKDVEIIISSDLIRMCSIQGQIKICFQPCESTIFTACICLGDALISSSKDANIRYWNLVNPSASFTIGEQHQYFRDVSDNIVVFQETKKADVKSDVSRHTDSVKGVAVLSYPFSMLISVSNDKTIKVWK